MNAICGIRNWKMVSAGCHINDVMNECLDNVYHSLVSAGCHINDVMNELCFALE